MLTQSLETRTESLPVILGPERGDGIHIRFSFRGQRLNHNHIVFYMFKLNLIH